MQQVTRDDWKSPTIGRWMAWATLLVALFLLPVGAFGAESCLDCAGTPDSIGVIQAACLQYAERIDKHERKYEACVDICSLRGTSPNSAGHCGGTRECLDTCRNDRAKGSERATRRARRRIRKSCAPTISRCSISRSIARSACELLRTETTPLLSSSVPGPDTAATATGLQTSGEREACRPACVADKLKICFADCDDACGGDDQARGFCYGACKNKGCGAIVALCDCEEGDDCDMPSRTTTTTVTTLTSTTATAATTTTLTP
jgi:hypothetical protein